MSFVFFLVWVTLVIVTGIVASNKGRSVGGWVLLAILVAPIVLLILLALPSLKEPAPVAVRTLPPAGPPPVPVAEKTCPRCAETVKAAAKVCRFCGHEFGEEAAHTAALVATAPRLPEGTRVHHVSHGNGEVIAQGRPGRVVVRFADADKDVGITTLSSGE